MGVDSLLQLLRERMKEKQTGGAVLVPEAFADYSRDETQQASKWMTLAQDNSSGNAKMQVLDTYLAAKSVLVGIGTRITIADLGVFLSIRDAAAAFPVADQGKFINFFRWFDYVQNKEDVQQVYELIPVSKTSFNPPNLAFLDPSNSAAKAPNDKAEAAAVVEKKDNAQPVKLETADAAKRPAVEHVKQETKEKEKKDKAPAQKKEVDCDISVLDICVGQINKVWKHPSADSLYVEEIDVGEGQPRQVVSGLVKYVSEEDMLNRRVLVLLNVKPGKVRDVLSSGLVLCASSDDHSVCQPVSPPEGVPVGERVKFEGRDGKPEDVLNPKKKQWEKIAADLRTDAHGVANYQDVKFQTSRGVCTSTILNGIGIDPVPEVQLCFILEMLGTLAEQLSKIDGKLKSSMPAQLNSAVDEEQGASAPERVWHVFTGYFRVVRGNQLTDGGRENSDIGNLC